MRMFGVAGSLRPASYNRAPLEAARELCPESMRLDLFDLDDIPLYNSGAGSPEGLRDVRDAARVNRAAPARRSA